MIQPINITFEDQTQSFDVPVFSPDGFSPLASTTRVEGGAQLSVTDNRGTTTSIIYDGEKGDTGATGPQGIGISRIEQTEISTESGFRNVITIYLTDGTSYSFYVYNGEQGETGAQGPQGPKGDTGATGATGPAGMDVRSVAVGSDGRLYFYMNNGSLMVASGNVIGPQGPQGVQGETGEQGETGPQGEQGEIGTGIDHIEQTTIGTGDESYNEVTIYLDNGESYTFQVKNGSKGATGAQGEKGDRGYGITRTVVGSDGKLYLYFENGSVMVAGYVKGDKGNKGDKGDTGEAGTVEFYEQSTEPSSAEAGAIWLDTSV